MVVEIEMNLVIWCRKGVNRN